MILATDAAVSGDENLIRRVGLKRKNTLGVTDGAKRLVTQLSR